MNLRQKILKEHSKKQGRKIVDWVVKNLILKERAGLSKRDVDMPCAEGIVWT
jgi:hypothetical protein